MATFITAEQRAQLIELYIGYFNRAPEKAGLDYWAGQLLDLINSGKTEDEAFQTIADQFYDAGVQFGLYGASDTTQEFITRIYKNALGRDTVDADGMNYWTQKLESGEVSRGQFVRVLLKEAREYVAKNPNSEYAWVTTYLENRKAVGEWFAQNSTGLTGQAAINQGTAIIANSVTKETAQAGQTAAQAVSAAQASQTAQQGQTFTLTTGIDNLVGTGGNDTFKATASGTAAANNWNTGDVIDGGAGDDAVNLTLQEVNGAAANVELKNIETLNIRNLGTDTNVEQVSLLLSSASRVVLKDAVGTDAVTLNNLDSTKTTVVVQNQPTIASTTNIASTINALTGSSDALNLEVNGAGTISSTAPVVATIGVGSLAFETINLKSTGVASNVTLNGTAAGLATLNVSGDAKLNLNAGSTVLNNLTKLDASAMTAGGLVVDLSNNTKNIQATGSKADDSIAFGSSLNVGDVVDGGDGTDKLTATVNTATTYLPTISNVETLDLTFSAAGTMNLLNTTGVQTLDITNTTAATITNASGIANLIFDTSTSGSSASIAYKAGDKTDITVTVGKTTTAGTSTDAINIGGLTLSNNGGKLTIDSVADKTTTSNQTGNTDIGNATALTLNAKSAALTLGAVTAAKLATLTANATAAGVTVGGIATANELTTIAINATKGDVALGTINGDDSLTSITIVTGTNAGGTDTSASLTIGKSSSATKDVEVSSLTISGEGDATVTFGANTTIQTIDASAATGSVTINGGSSLNKAITVKLGNAASGETNTVTTSGGADNVTGGSGADSISTGGGNDIIIAGGGADTITAGGGDDVIDLSETTAAIDTINFEFASSSHSSNGSDVITGFDAGATNGDVLNFFGGTNAFITNFAIDSDLTNGTVQYANTEVARIIKAGSTLANTDIALTASTANKVSVADNATVIVLVADSTSSSVFNVYEARDTDSTAAQNYVVTLIGTVTLAAGDTFNSLVNGNIN